MSKLTKDDVDRQFGEMNEFEKTIPGIRYGADYPEFALAIVGSEAFKSMVRLSTMMGLVSMITFQTEERKIKIQSGRGDEVLDEMDSDTQMREQLLMALYLGYKLGKGEKHGEEK